MLSGSLIVVAMFLVVAGLVVGSRHAAAAGLDVDGGTSQILDPRGPNRPPPTAGLPPGPPPGVPPTSVPTAGAVPRRRPR